ncbi:MAG: hypothetical protein R6V23_05165 [Bacteroidales bacterium]
MRKILLLLLLLLNILLSVQSQDNSYLNYRVIIPSYTNCYAQKGDLKIAYQRQNYSPDMRDYSIYKSWLLEYAGYFISNFIVDTQNRFLLTYSINDRITIGAGFVNLYRIGEYFKLEEDDIFYRSVVNSYELSVSYHKSIIPSLEYSFGTGLLAGAGYFSYRKGYNDETEEQLDYSTFNHNFSGSISYRFKKLRMGLMVNTGYLYHFNTNPSSLNTYYYENMVYNFNKHKTDFYIDPAFLIGIQGKRIGILGNIAYPYSFGESKISRPTLMMGIGLSVKILSGKKRK